ncbi:hypothetical protein IAI18_19805 [Acetobacteraceae bacterium H6797]|nr:hypothetical protein [Acetobacteraceae bacterium H6797]
MNAISAWPALGLFLLALAGCETAVPVDRLRYAAPQMDVEVRGDWRSVNACVMDHYSRQSRYLLPDVDDAGQMATLTVFAPRAGRPRSAASLAEAEVTTVALSPTTARSTLRRARPDEAENGRIRQDLERCGLAVVSS